MATANEIIALVRSHSLGDAARFRAVATAIAANAEKRGNSVFAGRLRQQLAQMQPEALRATALPSQLAGLVNTVAPNARMTDLVVNEDISSVLTRLLREYRERERLEAAGLKPRRRLLLTGPPGTGKTMTAGVLAIELGLPLHIVRHDAIITKFMGESAAKLRLVFDAIRTHPAVWLFDEFDAFAADRGLDNDVGEARRMLNSILQMMEEDAPGLVIAATNHPVLLDRAIFRRFDLRIDYQLPETGFARRVMSGTLPAFDLTGIDWDAVDEVVAGLSHSDLGNLAMDTARACVLDGDGTIATADIVGHVQSRHGR